MSVFFWILLGLTWIGGVVSMLTDQLNTPTNDINSIKIILPKKLAKWFKQRRARAARESSNDTNLTSLLPAQSPLNNEKLPLEKNCKKADSPTEKFGI
jgi:hypothetical protein